MAKLTLSVDARVIAQAKQYATRRNVSVSSLVESYLSSISEDQPTTAKTKAETPVLLKLRGILKHGGSDDYRRHLAQKYL